MPLLTADGAPTIYRAPGIFDGFDYPDGPLAELSPRWSDAFEVWPASFDQSQVIDGVLNTTGSTVNVWPFLAEHPAIVGHNLVAVDLADYPVMTGHTDDDFAVSVVFDTTDPFAVTSQISPAAFVDFNAAGYREMGVLPVWDVSVIATYMQTAFRPVSIGRVFDYKTLAEGDDDDLDYYDYLSAPQGRLWSAGPANPRQCITIRARNGQCRGYWNGDAITPVVDVPAWALGRTRVGIHVISNHFEIGQPVGPLGPVDHVVQDLITGFHVTPFTGTL